MRCERCGRFIGEDCSEGWSGGLFGDYNGRYYCANGKGCNKIEAPLGAGEPRPDDPVQASRESASHAGPGKLIGAEQGPHPVRPSPAPSGVIKPRKFCPAQTWRAEELPENPDLPMGYE